jgi:hypothetical protein
MTLPNGEPQLPEPHISRFQSGHCCFGQVPTPSKDQLPPCFDADRTRASLITRNTIEDFAALAVSQFFFIAEKRLFLMAGTRTSASALVCNAVPALVHASRVSPASPVSDSLWVVDQRYRSIRDLKLENLRCVFGILP